jgi:8-oxo-dGTP pyrophosphatase MutT (NUDIX family)
VKKANMSVGVFAGIFNSNGEILLRRRTEEGSIIPGKSFKRCYELPGGAVMETDEESIPYDYILRELEREVKEETGLLISIDRMSFFFPVAFKLEKPARYDLAMVTVVYQEQVLNLVDGNIVTGPQKDCIFVSTERLNELARRFVAPKKEEGIEGEGLLSGYGKRMHCMALAALHKSPNIDCFREAVRTLTKIQMEW